MSRDVIYLLIIVAKAAVDPTIALVTVPNPSVAITGAVRLKKIHLTFITVSTELYCIKIIYCLCVYKTKYLFRIRPSSLYLKRDRRF